MVKTVNTKRYGSEAMINNAILSWNNIQKFILSHSLNKNKPVLTNI